MTHYCTNCGADLENQFGFDPDEGYWTCTECGTMLIDPEYSPDNAQYDGVAWFCDNCGSFLNKQFGFSDWEDSWECSECGHINNLSEDDIYESKEDWKKEQREESINQIGNAVAAVIGAGMAAYTAKRQQEKAIEEQRQLEKEFRRNQRKLWRKKHRKGIRVIVLSLFLLFIGYVSYYELSKLSSLEHASSDLKGLNYSTVEYLLNTAGFNRVIISEVADLPIEKINEEKTVTSVKLLWIDNFSKSTKYPSNLPIFVEYHSIEKIAVPLSSSKAKGEDYESILCSFKKSGFINISVVPQYDIVTGWITEDGAIESITINGKDSFSESSTFRPDSEIVIVYHTYKKNKP